MQQEYLREITLSGIIKTIRINLKVFLICLIPLVLTLIGVLIFLNYSQVVKYTVSSTIQVNNFTTQGNNNIDLQMNQYLDNSIKPMTALISSQGLASSSQTMTKLLTSSYILHDIIESNQLDIEYKYIPNKSPTAWFQEKPHQPLAIGVFNVNHSQYNVDYILRFSTESTYVLSTQSKRVLGIGSVGVESSFNGIMLLINSQQPIGSKFSIRKKSMDVTIADLDKVIEIEPVMINQKYSQADTGIINVSMTGTNPVRQAKLINDIILQTQQKTLEQQQKVLNTALLFLAKQIEVTQADLLDKQAQLVKFQDSKHVVNLNEQVKRDLTMLTDFDIKIMEKQVTIDQFKSLYAPSHPLMIALQKQKASLVAKRDSYAKDLQNMPSKDALYANIKRNLDVSQQMYLYLVNKEQNLQLEYASTVSPVTLLSPATANVAPIIIPLSTKLIASSILGLVVLEIVLIVLYVFMVNGDPFLFAKTARTNLLTIIPFFPKNRKAGDSYKINHPSINTLASYLFSIKPKDKPLMINLGSIKSGSGKSLIISTVMGYMYRMSKRSIHMQFGTAVNYMPLAAVYDYLPELNKVMDKNIVLKININNMLNDELLNDLLSRVEGFDFVFIESPSFMSSGLFLSFARLVSETIIVTTPKDTEANIELVVSGLRSIEIIPRQVIFNHPQKRLLNSVYSIVNAHKV